MPSRLYFVTDQSEPNEEAFSFEADEEEKSLAGAETTGARLDDLFQSGNESGTSTSQVNQPLEEIEETKLTIG